MVYSIRLFLLGILRISINLFFKFLLISISSFIFHKYIGDGVGGLSCSRGCGCGCGRVWGKYIINLQYLFFFESFVHIVLYLLTNKVLSID